MTAAGFPMPLRYIVTRRNWRRAADRWVRLPGDTFVCGCWSPHDAEQARLRGDAAAWSRTGNPFAAVGSVAGLTTLPEFALADFLMERGLSPPSARADGTRNWSAWWADRHKFWTDAQVATIRAALDRFRFFDVEALPLDRTAVVAVRPVWEYVEDPYVIGEEYYRPTHSRWDSRAQPGFYPGDDGGRPDRAFRELEDAVAYRALVEEERRYVRPSEEVLSGPVRRWLPDGGYWARRSWYDPRNTILDWTTLVAVRGEEVPPVQLYEVEYDDDDGGPAGSTAYLVYRTGWGPIRYLHPSVEVAIEDAVTQPDGYVESRLVPVAICTTRPRAEGRAAELEDRDRREFNPMLFLPHARGGSRPSIYRLRQRLIAAGLLSEPEFVPLVNLSSSGEYLELAYWWEENSPGWPPDVRDKAWEALYGPALYGVSLIDFEG